MEYKNIIFEKRDGIGLQQSPGLHWAAAMS